MGKFEHQLRDLFSSLQSAWRRHARGGAADGPGGQPRRNPGDLRRTEAARKAQEAVRDVRTGEASRRAQEAVRDLRHSDTARKAQEAVRDLRNSEAGQKAQATMREFRESETGRKAESTIQEAEAAARAAYLRLRRSMGDR
jgi:hypothetical protein